MRNAIVFLYEHLRNVNAIRVVVLTEAQTSGRGQPRDELVAGAALNLIRASHKLGLSHVHNDLHFTCESRKFKIIIDYEVQL